MLKFSWKKKLIAMLLIFTLTFADFALVGKTYAASLIDAFSNKGDTGSANVEFDASFVVSKEAQESSETEVKNETETSSNTVTNTANEATTENEVENKAENTSNGVTNSVMVQSGSSNTTENEANTTNETNEVENSTNEVTNETKNTVSNQVTVQSGSSKLDNQVGTAIKTEETKELEADVNSTNLSLKLNVKVSNSGYLKDAKIVLGNGEELNFAINSENFENSMVQNFEDNKLELVQMNSDSEATITIPIYYNQTSYMQAQNVSKTNTIKFEGTYVDDDKETTISKDVDLSLNWKDNRQTSVTSEVTKYINFSVDGADGIILQTLIKADNTTESKTLPVESSSIDVEVPTLNGTKPESVKVVASALMGSTGEEIDDVSFGSDNWSYNQETNKLNITVQNQSKEVSIQNEDETLIDETLEKVQAYSTKSGTDEYLVTYIYKNVSLENLVEANSKITSTFKMYGGTELTASQDAKYELTEQIGDIVTFSTETSTESISKGYTYLNYNNSDNKYEIEIDNKLIFNISYKDIVSGLYYEDSANYYVSNSGESFEQNDLYYKSIKISKNNFNEILGEDGYINILDSQGNVLATINKDTETNENEVYELKVEGEDLRSIRIETSNPIAEGNLNITTVKAYKDTSFDKESFKTFEKINMNSVAKARYTDVADLVDCGEAVTEVKLEDTKTNAKLVIGQSSLSTLAINNNVELKIELNNDKITSDVYGESEFLIKMPDYIDSLEITDYSIVYGEGLEISNVELFEQDGSIYARVSVTGNQTALSSGIVSNGTNIVLNANIKVNLYAPAVTTNFELLYVNDEATSYETMNGEYGYSAAAVKYSAPSGVISVNSISDYDANGSTVASVKQGKMTGNLAIYSNSRTATMELIVMNNEENAISNMYILGRTIFAGNKDLETNEDLGTTMDAPMVSGISSDSNNGADFTIYYSTNAEATSDLNDSNNGWETSVSDWSSVKSYLIVPNSSDYTLNATEKLRFTYQFTIPENLSHNNDFYGTFGTYYTNNTAIATVDEVSIPDLVGISTGVGPELSIENSSSVSEINEFEQFEYTTIVKNTGKVTATGVTVTVPVPDNLKYISTSTENTNVETVEGMNLNYKLSELASGEELKIVTTFETEEFMETDHSHEETESEDNHSIKLYSTVTADDFGTTLQTNEIGINVKDAKIKAAVYESSTDAPEVLSAGNEVILDIAITNLDSVDYSNINVTTHIDEAFDMENLISTSEDSKDVDGNFDESTRNYSWNIDTLEAGESKTYTIYLKVKDFEGTELSRDVELKAIVTAGENTATSNAYKMVVGKPSLSIKQTTKTTNSYVKEGDLIEYVFSITNEGPVMAKGVTLTDIVPTGLAIHEISYEADGKTYKELMTEYEEATVELRIKPGETKDVTVVALAEGQAGVQELSVTNVGSLTNNNGTVTSNEVTHIIEGSSSSTVDDSGVSKDNGSTTSESNLLKTYNITGIAWIDSNRNGARDDSEELMKNIQATLVDSDTGVIKQKTVTNSNGEYKFSGVSNGNYIIIFDYDTVLYTVTTYRKENVASNLNSDAISTKVEQDGVYRNAAVTDVISINDGSISNIDIGLAEAMKFDLSLDMGVTKITVQNSQGTKTKTYDFSKYTKTEVSQRYLAGSEIYVEYTFKVTNEGEVAGYATNIVDYMPEGMNFNSSLNSSWFTGSDGNLYTTQLQNTEIQPGETKTFTLVLSKTMTNENTGTVSNTAEIASDYNIYGVSDIDSTPGNNNQNEDDFARVDTILGVGTGGVWIYISVIITTAALIGIAVFVINLKRKAKKLEGGV